MSTTDGSEVAASGCVQWLVVFSDAFCVFLFLMCVWFNRALCGVSDPTQGTSDASDTVYVYIPGLVFSSQVLLNVLLLLWF